MIVAAAEELGADLIVMATHQRQRVYPTTFRECRGACGQRGEAARLTYQTASVLNRQLGCLRCLSLCHEPPGFIYDHPGRREVKSLALAAAGQARGGPRRSHA